MAKVLIEVRRQTQPFEMFLEGLRRNHIMVIESEKLNRNDIITNLSKAVQFLEIEEDEGEACVKVLAKANPGCEVRMYRMESVGVCPSGDFVNKKVSKEGVLPA